MERLIMDTPYGEPFIDEFDRMGIEYMELRGEYALGHCNKEEARYDVQCWLDIDTAAAYAFAIAMGLIKCTSGLDGPEGANIAQDQDRPADEETIAAGPPIVGYIKRIPFGTKGSPQQLKALLDHPGQVAPPEGHGAALDAGEAELPIPEGCSSPTWSGCQDGQSCSGNV